MSVDLKQYTTFGSDNNVLAQYSSDLGVLESQGLALAACNLNYGQEIKHFVETIKAEAKNITGVIGHQFSFSMEASLTDNSNHHAVAAATFTAPVVLKSDGEPSLEFQTGQVDDLRKFTFSFPLKKARSVLGGFALSFKGKDRRVFGLTARTSILDDKVEGNTTTVSVTASINAEPNVSAPGDAYVLVIGQKEGDPTLFESTTWNTGDREVTVRMKDLTRPIGQVAVFIESFEVDYEDRKSHDVRQFLLDAGNNSLKVTNDSNEAVITFSPKLVLTDGDKLAKGSLSLLVMAVPA
ncbi:MAG TPA: hypothetical protein VF173_37905 [Thermoanaerobaculia bacterium]|nr:hypothetical protein [Thermoanaerobaculia bacterium]